LGIGREVNLNVKDNTGKTAIDIIKEKMKIAKYWESEEEFQERKRKSAKNVELLESFERNPNEIRTKLRIQLGFAGKNFIVFLFFFFCLFENSSKLINQFISILSRL